MPVVTRGLTHYWNSKDGVKTGSVLKNLAPGGVVKDAVVTGAAYNATTGLLAINGPAANISIPDMISQRTLNPLTVDFVINLKQVPSGTYHPLYEGILYLDVAPGGLMYFEVYSGSGHVFRETPGIAAMNTTGTKNVTIRVNGTAVDVFVNGANVYSGAIPAGYSFAHYAETDIGIGTDVVGPSLDMDVGAMRIYNVALTDAEIAQNNTNGFEIGLGAVVPEPPPKVKIAEFRDQSGDLVPVYSLTGHEALEPLRIFVGDETGFMSMVPVTDAGASRARLQSHKGLRALAGTKGPAFGTGTPPPDPEPDPDPGTDLGEPASYPSTLIYAQGSDFIDYPAGGLRLSRDGGHTYSPTLSVSGLGEIKYQHVFQDGTLMFATQDSVFRSTDMVTRQEATYVGATPSGISNFSTYVYDPNPQMVDGVEIRIWGTYSFEDPMQRSSGVRLWYTADKGQTMKVAMQFNVGGAFNCRHVHAVIWDPLDESFLALVGDDDFDSSVFRGVYTVATDTWSWTEIGTSYDYKWGSCLFHGDYIYFSHDHGLGGSFRVTRANIGNPAAFERVQAEVGEHSVNIIKGERGDMVASAESSEIWYSPDGLNFTNIQIPSTAGLSAGTTMWDRYMLTNQGRLFASGQDEAQIHLDDWEGKPYIFIDDYIKAAGFPDAINL